MKSPVLFAGLVLFWAVCSFGFSATLYVDHDGPNDPGADDTAVSDPLDFRHNKTEKGFRP